MFDRNIIEHTHMYASVSQIKYINGKEVTFSLSFFLFLLLFSPPILCQRQIQYSDLEKGERDSGNVWERYKNGNWKLEQEHDGS